MNTALPQPTQETSPREQRRPRILTPSMLRAYCIDDPILDWLDMWGRPLGFERDVSSSSGDPRTDPSAFIRDQAHLFADGIREIISKKIPYRQVAHTPSDARDPASAAMTIALMASGMPVIGGAVLVDPVARLSGVADLVVRVDIFEALFPEMAKITAPNAAGRWGPWHHRVIDIRFTTLSIRFDGHAGSSMLTEMAQVSFLSDLLGRMQGYTPPSSYLLGRAWSAGRERGFSALDRLARVDTGVMIGESADRPGRPLASVVAGAIDWLRRVEAEGSEWSPEPVPSVPEIYPNMSNTRDVPWHGAKRQIAAAIDELTLLPGVGPTHRRRAHAAGMLRWIDPRVSPSTLGVTPPETAARCGAVLTANRDALHLVIPEKITLNDDSWRAPAPIEFFVDFEIVGNLADDFSALPAIGQGNLIVQIGCGYVDTDSVWRFAQWTADTITPGAESSIIAAWIDHMERVSSTSGTTLAETRILHWSPAESTSFSAAYASSRARLGTHWPELPFYDLLDRVVGAVPVGIRGAFSFGLKSMVEALSATGEIPYRWPSDGPGDGLGAMVGIVAVARAAAAAGVTITDDPLVRAIARYNEADCHSMSDILDWLRRNR